MSMLMAGWLGEGCKRDALGLVREDAGAIGDAGQDAAAGDAGQDAAAGAAGATADAGAETGDAMAGDCIVHPLGVGECGCGARWVRTVDEGTEDGAAGLAASAGGEVILAGWTRGSATGSYDAWVRKYGVQGEEIWTRTFDGGGDERALGLAVDRGGNVVVSGSAGTEGWLRKYSSAGDVLWTLRGGPPRDAVATDDAGNVVVTGPSVGASKYDPAGGPLWTWPSTGGVPTQNWTSAIAVDAGGNVAVVGTVRQDDGPIGTENWRTDIYVRRLDPGGAELWTRTHDGGRDDWGYAVAVDGQRNVIVAGRSYLRPPAGSFSYQGWLRKYDPSGAELWTRAEEGAGGREVGNRIAVDDAGNVSALWLGIYKYDGNGTFQGREPCPADLLAIDSAGRRLLAGEVARPSGTFESRSDVWIGSYSP